MNEKKYQTDNKSFMIYKDWKEIVNILTDEQAGVLFKALFEFSVGNSCEMSDPMIKMAYTMMSNTIERDGLKWEEICKARSDSGKKGGRPKKANGFSENQKKAKEADIDKDIDIDKEIEKDIVTETDREIDRKKERQKENANANENEDEKDNKNVNSGFDAVAYENAFQQLFGSSKKTSQDSESLSKLF